MFFVLFEGSAARHFSFNRSIVLSGSALNDGQWHSVELHSKRGRLSVAVDQEERGSAQASPSFPVVVESHLYFGGKDEIRQL